MYYQCHITTLSAVLLILQKLEKCVDPAYSETNALVVITGSLLKVLFVSGSTAGVTADGAETNSNSFTVKVAGFDVTVVAAGFVNTQRNCSDGVVGYVVAGVVYDGVFAPLILDQEVPSLVEICH